ncbi:hypothetical protein [Bacteroides thetaiotaomicron]|uniref:hypothetical protein n=1 Tax=Bacteroides thetaiotaomicron TaxID=818 RepID=UPI001E44C66A|nr:hypothetical protein [Bacteroides thetaiotaomicron]
MRRIGEEADFVPFGVRPVLHGGIAPFAGTVRHLLVVHEIRCGVCSRRSPRALPGVVGKHAETGGLDARRIDGGGAAIRYKPACLCVCKYFEPYRRCGVGTDVRNLILCTAHQ